MRAKITPKRTRSTVSSNSGSSSGQASPRQTQASRVIELSKPKIRNTASVPNCPAKGPRIVKPVQRSNSGLPKSCPSPSPSPKPSPRHQATRPSSSSPSKIPSPSVSKIPTPSRSRIPVKGSHTRPPVTADHHDNDEVLFISEEGVATSDDSMEVSETRSPFPGRKMMARRDSRESRSSSNTMEVEEEEEIVEEGNDDDFPPPPIPEEAPELPPPEFPAPPAPADLEKMSLEAEMSSPRRPEEERRPVTELEADPMITTPRTLRRADSMRQRMAARRIQRTWKHFYQEVSVRRRKSCDNKKYCFSSRIRSLMSI